MYKECRFTLAATGAFMVGCGAHPGTPPADQAKAVFEAYVQAWNHHDFAAFDTLLAPDGIHEDLAQGFKGQGSAQVQGFMRDLIKAEPDFDWHVTSMVTAGEEVAAEWTWTTTYTGPSPTGPVVNRHISGRGASIVIVEGGRIKRLTDYYDTASYFPPAPVDSVRH